MSKFHRKIMILRFFFIATFLMPISLHQTLLNMSPLLFTRIPIYLYFGDLNYVCFSNILIMEISNSPYFIKTPYSPNLFGAYDYL